jgi:tetratricopeptide (TPR) repeat protein
MKKEKPKVIEKSTDQIYEDLIDLMQSTQCMTITASKIEMYKNIADQFTELKSFQESEAYAEKCRQLAQKTEKELKKRAYEKAQTNMNKAKIVSEYKAAAEEFKKASGYKNADTLAAQCEEISTKIENKSIKKNLVQKVSIIAGILLLILIALLPFGRYYAANTFLFLRAYPTAAKIYDKLGDYKTSEEKLKKSQYMIGRNLYKEEDYKGAAKAFSAADDYKDSEEKEVSMIKLILQNEEPGDTVMIGGYNWILLNKSEDKALLIKKVALDKRAYNAEAVGTSWENSSLRQFLNSDFLLNTFSESERNSIILSIIENNKSVYGTDGGNNTQDSIFLLSTEEANEYKTFIKGFKGNSWLRSPGNSQNSAAFMTEKGTIMEYGYMVSSEEFTVHPVMWFNIK